MRARLPSRPSAVVGVLMATIAGLFAAGAPTAAAGPPAAVDDGPPDIWSTVPQTVTATGGGPIRIHGRGFGGTVEVTFGPIVQSDGGPIDSDTTGTVPAVDFEVVDGTLITATVPPMPAHNNKYIHVYITDNEGMGDPDPGDPATWVLYSNGRVTVTPETGVHVGDVVRVNLTGYRPNASVVLPQFNPLLLFLEGDYPSGPFGPPQYADVAYFLNTDANGDLLNGASPRSVPVVVSNLLNGNGLRQTYDPNIVCPSNQITADYGLNQCAMALSGFGTGTIEHFFSFVNDPVPAPPTLALSNSTALPGQTVSLSGVRWNASPYFGSDVAQDDPGETELVVELCDVGLTSCSAAASDARVEMTRYFDADPNFPFPLDFDHTCPDPNFPGNCVQPLFTGATLSGSMAVEGVAGCAPNCLVRVRQERYDYNTQSATGTFIQATAPLTVGPPPLQAVADFNGDGTTDVSVFRPSSGEWFVAGGSPEHTAYGTGGDIAVPGDYDGDDKADIAVFRPSTGTWFVHHSSGGDVAVIFGTVTDVPVPVDYDGDGRTDVAVFRPSTGTWFIHRSTGGDTALTYGTDGDVPVPADYDGDGRADIAVFRPSTGTWFIHHSSGGDTALTYGTDGDVPVPADYDGDGTADIAVFRPSAGEWFIRNSSGGDTALLYGTDGDIPVPGNYDGDGRTDVAVFRPSTGTWFVHRSTGGDTALTYGAGTDVPLPLPHAINADLISGPQSPSADLRARLGATRGGSSGILG